ncbi:hypothetical protein BAZSYMA_ACONTIG118939_0 [Bathymodiolus azoricus thioautotrophic gill symbiont]|uniref:Secreted protein n=1 Tax=Bathymodiolus azoricus thioautotrophic gill symbiont TaxID=235205 RepID=A0A1H6MFE2_9GAMM|nr:hypothetical protein BAZSYMA_ACONTIG118939_0 [Bathymodiolus azoricus thioautotrophic gill symbiont]
MGFFVNIFCKRLTSFKVWLLLLFSTFDRDPAYAALRLNLISCAPSIFCTTKPCCSTSGLNLDLDFFINVICL